jgi:hypothetical protein
MAGTFGPMKMALTEESLPDPPETLSSDDVLLRFVRVVPGEASGGLVPFYHFQILTADGLVVAEQTWSKLATLNLVTRQKLPPSEALSRVCTRVVQGLKCRKSLILLTCQGVKGLRGGEGGGPFQAAIISQSSFSRLSVASRKRRIPMPKPIQAYSKHSRNSKLFADNKVCASPGRPLFPFYSIPQTAASRSTAVNDIHRHQTRVIRG